MAQTSSLRPSPATLTGFGDLRGTQLPPPLCLRPLTGLLLAASPGAQGEA